MANLFFIPSSVNFFALLWLLSWANYVTGVHHCLTSKLLCNQDSSCSLLLHIANENCGRSYESACTAHDLLTCRAALKALHVHSIFQSACICTDEISDIECHQFYNYVFKNPCLAIIDAVSQSDEQIPSCNFAFKSCSENTKCKRIFEYFKRFCKFKNDLCLMKNRAKCQQAIARMQLTPLNECQCHTNSKKCEKIYHIVHDNPCIDAFKVQPLQHNQIRSQSEIDFPQDNVQITATLQWKDNLPLGSDGGASLPSKSQTPSRVSSISINPSDNSEVQLLRPPAFLLSRPEISDDTPPSSSTIPSLYKFQMMSHVKYPSRDAAHMNSVAASTCYRAKKSCEADSACKSLLEKIFVACRENGVLCNRTECLAAVRQFYSFGNRNQAFEIAFCSCGSHDETCRALQRQLHPVCATQSQNDPKQCEQLVETCYADDDCKFRLQRFLKACAVDGITAQCQNPSHTCREALVDIQGTPLRITCSCTGRDISSIYKCTEWQRKVWINPCVDQVVREALESQSINLVAPTPDTKVTLPNFNVKPTLSVNGFSPLMTSTLITPTISTAPVLTTDSCFLDQGSTTIKLPHGSGKRVYDRNEPDCSSICLCDINEGLTCRVLQCERISCQTSFAVYTHASPAYQAYRGRCICYSGNFICMKPSPLLYTLRQGVFLFLGYSEIEERFISPYTKTTILNSVERLKTMMEERRKDGDDNGGCKLQLYKLIGGNIVMQAYLEEFNVDRENNTLAEGMILKEKEVCYPHLKYLTDLINDNDQQIKTDILASLFKIAEVEVHVKEPSSGHQIQNSVLRNNFTHGLIVLLGLFASLTSVSL